jgi:SpoVK/Ycf46/Vps4 family AAA+-type ATPase
VGNLGFTTTKERIMQKKLETLFKAQYSLLAIKTFEEIRVLKTIYNVITPEKNGTSGNPRPFQRKMYCWSYSKRMFSIDSDENLTEMSTECRQPEEALKFFDKLEENAVLCLLDFDPFLKSPDVCRRMRDAAYWYRRGVYKKHIVMISTQCNFPTMLKKDVYVLNFDLPTEKELGAILDSIIDSFDPVKHADIIEETKQNREAIVKASLGITEEEASNIYAKIYMDTKKFDPRKIAKEKRDLIRKDDILDIIEETDIKEIGGLDILKKWLKKRRNSFSQKARDFGLPEPKGLLAIGIPGCGKSLTMKAIGNLWGLPILKLDMGKMFGSLVGESESNMRKALQVAESIAPSILWIDEIEKGLSMNGSDSGTTSRVFSTILTWMQEKSKTVFVAATANDISKLPPELLRKGRFDEIFFVDLPNTMEREEILKIHLRKVKRNPENFDMEVLVKATKDFSGAEIEQVIKDALFHAFDEETDLTTEMVFEEVTSTVPISTTMKEKIMSLRSWCKDHARPATSPLEKESGTRFSGVWNEMTAE